MNEHSLRPTRPPTQAGEGFPRWRWTLAEFDRLTELGILGEDDKVELIGGEIIPMAARGVKHEDLKEDLQDWFEERLPESARLRTELGWRPDGETYCEPDMIVFQGGRKRYNTAPASDVLLLVEIADSTLKFDLQTKAQLYARLGVPEYWSVNVVTLETKIHRQPSSRGYGYKRNFDRMKLLKPVLVPQLAVRLGEAVRGPH